MDQHASESSRTEKRKLLNQFCRFLAEDVSDFVSKRSTEAYRIVFNAEREQSGAVVLKADIKGSVIEDLIEAGTWPHVMEQLRTLRLEGLENTGHPGTERAYTSESVFSCVFPIDGEAGGKNIKIIERYVRENLAEEAEKITKENIAVRDAETESTILAALAASGALRQGITPQEMHHTVRLINRALRGLGAAERER